MYRTPAVFAAMHGAIFVFYYLLSWDQAGSAFDFSGENATDPSAWTNPGDVEFVCAPSPPTPPPPLRHPVRLCEPKTLLRVTMEAALENQPYL